MIKKRTVIVSGAGASAAYGFPLGGQMKSRIAAALASEADGSDATVIAEATGAPLSTIHEFRAALERSAAPSIDAFLEDVGEVHDVIGRCAIALHLLQLESDDRLFPEKGDWLGALFDAILRDPSAFRENFKLVTFNFDRSHERRLFLELAKRLPGTPLEADPYFDDVYNKLVHVHGHLGRPSWQKLYRFGNQFVTREYAPTRDPARVAISAKNVRIFRDGLTDGHEQAIRYCLNWAERILFVGFSYHPANLLKLGAPDTLAGKDVRGTVLGMADDEIARLRELTGGHIQIAPRDWGAEDIVRHCGWFGVDA